MREESIQYLTRARPWPANETNRWGLFRNPLPPASEHRVFRDVREDAGLPSREVLGPRYDALSADLRAEFLAEFAKLADQHNPIVRRVVRRTRPMLEERGLLRPIGVVTHPREGDGLSSSLFDGGGLGMSLAFKAAYDAAEEFSRRYALRRPGAGFLKTILLRRIGSSAQAGLDTARLLLTKLDAAIVPEGEQGDEGEPDSAAPPEGEEIERLCHVAVPRARSVGASGIVRPPRPPSATWSSPQREARGAFGLR